MEGKNNETTSELYDKAELVVREAYSLAKIETADQYDLAVLKRKEMKVLLSEIDAAFKPQIDAAKLTLSLAKEALEKFRGPAEKADGILKQAVARWEAEQRRIAEENKRIAQELGAEELIDIAEAEKPKATTSVRKLYSAEVVNLMDLVRAVALGTVSIEYLQVNQVAVNELARSFKEQFSLPGCKLVVKEAVWDGRS